MDGEGVWVGRCVSYAVRGKEDVACSWEKSFLFEIEKVFLF